MEEPYNEQNPLFEALEGASPLGVPDLPKIFLEEMRRHFRLDGNGRMLVLWCGAGAFLPLAKDFESILIVDPEPGRLANAAWNAERLGIENAILLEGGAEILHPRMGQFRLVVVQDVFLRMDRMRQLSFLANMTEPSGGIAVADIHRYGPLTDWQKSALAVLHRFEGVLPAGKPRFWYPSEWHEHSPPFRQTKIFTHCWTQKRTIGQTIDGILTTLCPSPKEQPFLEAALKTALQEAEPTDILEERLRLTAVFAK